MRRGEVWTVAGGGNYTGKPRTAVIVQDDSFDATASITICAFTTDPTKKTDIITVRKEDFARVWKEIEEKGEAKETEIRPLIGFDKLEFIWTVLNRLDYCEYDLRRIKFI